MGQLVAKELWSQDKFLLHLLWSARKHFRDNIFTPYNILQEMDLVGGTLSYGGIDVLRRAETCGVKRFRGLIIPSNSELKRMAGAVDAVHSFHNRHCLVSQCTSTMLNQCSALHQHSIWMRLENCGACQLLPPLMGLRFRRIAR